jgi:hypothetical protein
VAGILGLTQGQQPHLLAAALQEQQQLQEAQVGRLVFAHMSHMTCGLSSQAWSAMSVSRCTECHCMVCEPMSGTYRHNSMSASTKFIHKGL